MIEISQIEQFVARLKSATQKERSSLNDEFYGYVNSGLSAEAGLRVIKAAIELGLNKEFPALNASANSLIGYLADSRFPREHGVSVSTYLVEHFPLLAKFAGTYTLWFLMNIPEPEGAQAVMEVVRRYFDEDIFPEHGIHTHYNHPLHANIYFPELLDYAFQAPHSSPAFCIWQICLKYCEDGVLKPEQIASKSGGILSTYQSLKASLIPYQSLTNWYQEYKYIVDRNITGLLLDLMRFFPTDEIKAELLSAHVIYRDPLLLCWATVAALNFNLSVPTETINLIAASAESRTSFYKMLQKQNRTKLFPEQYRTKVAFAQSDLVNWLIYPTELGAVPDAIELTHTLTYETEDGPMEVFLFRYQSTEWPTRGANDELLWLMGWSGPYPVASAPGEILTPSGTFSNFNVWDELRPIEHLRLSEQEIPLDRITIVSHIEI